MTASSLRFPPRRVFLLLLIPQLLVGVLAGYAARQAATDHEPAVAVPAAIAALVSVVGAAVVARTATGTVVLTDRTVSTPTLLGLRVTPLDDIAGVGLRYRSAGRGSGWAAYIWSLDGHRIGLNVAPPSHSAPKGSRTRWRPRPGVAPPLDWDYVADSPAARAATAIAGRLGERQGASGPWATRHLEARRDSAGSVHTAFWSPDGRCGTLPGARPSPAPRDRDDVGAA